MQSVGERAGVGRPAADVTGCDRHTYFCIRGDRLVIQRKVWSGCGSPALDLSGHDPSDNHLADRLYYLGQRGERNLYLGRAWLGQSSRSVFRGSV